MAGMEEIEVVVAHQACATLRVGDVFLKIDGDQTRTDVEVEAMALAPIPTPEILWRKPPVLALATVPGTALGRLGEPSPASGRVGRRGRRRTTAARRPAAAMARQESRRAHIVARCRVRMARHERCPPH